MNAHRLRRFWLWTTAFSVTAALGASLFWAFWPAYDMVVTSRSVTPSVSSMTPLEAQSRTLADVNGARVYLTLAIPVLLAALPLLARARRSRVLLTAVSAALLVGWVVLGSWSIGVAYAPAAILAVTALSVGVFWWRAGSDPTGSPPR